MELKKVLKVTQKEEIIICGVLNWILKTFKDFEKDEIKIILKKFENADFE